MLLEDNFHYLLEYPGSEGGAKHVPSRHDEASGGEESLPVACLLVSRVGRSAPEPRNNWRYITKIVSGNK